MAALVLSAPVSAQEAPPVHSQAPPIWSQMDDADQATAADAGLVLQHDRMPQHLLEDHRRLERALARLQPQRPGTVDAYVVVAALDTDPVFAREARETARVLSHRYGAEGRTIVLAGPDGRGGEGLPTGSPDALATALAAVAEKMDRHEDVLVLYTTSHGAPYGIVYDEGNEGFGAISPSRMWQMLSGLGIENRLVFVSACFAGVFVPLLQSPSTVIVTAASADHTSFGCTSDNDWTFFGDAMVNHALRKPQPLAAAAREAQGLIGGWEAKGGIIPSHPQVSIGTDTVRWLAPLEAHLPLATPMVGRPSLDSLDLAKAHNH